MTELALFEAAKAHIEAGRSIIPLNVTYDASGKKSVKPGVEWKKYQTQLPTIIDLQTWFEKKRCSQIGMVTGHVSGDIWVMDADGPEAVKWMAANAPPTTVYCQTRRGVHAYYRMPNGVDVACDVDVIPDLKNDTGDQIDIKGNGGLVTIPPSPHVDGFYEWKAEDWENLPVWSPPLKPKKTANLKLVRNVRREHPGFSTGESGVAEGGRNSKLASLAGQLFANGYGLEFVKNWGHDWNVTNIPPMDAEEVERTIISIHDAHQRNNFDKTWDESIEVMEFTGEEEDAVQEQVPVPAELLQPGGTLGLMMDYIKSRAYQPSPPLFALAASMVTVGTLIGQKVQTETGLRTNLYVIALADSGVGKNLPMTALESLVYEAGVETYLGPKRYASDAAMIAAISNLEGKNQKAIMSFMDEIGDLLCVLKGKQQATKLETISLMKELFSSTGSVYTKVYAEEKRNITVYHPHFSFYGTGVPLRFWEAITVEDIIDGFIARCLILTDESEIKRGCIPSPLPAPRKLVETMRAWADEPIKVAGNLSEIPVPEVVPKSSQAQAFFDTWQDTVVVQQNKYRKDERGRGAVFNRMAENASKIALIHAASLAGTIPREVSLESAIYATKFMDWYVNPTNANIRNVNGGRNDDIQKTLMRMLAPGKAIYQGKIIDTFRAKYNKKQILEALEMLEDSKKVELITKSDGPFGGKTTILWRKYQGEATTNERE